MKRKLLAAFVVVAFATAASAQITGSKHDFSGQAWNTSGEICLPCHTAHNGQNGSVVLWNHDESVVASYTLYASSTLDATMAQPSGESKLCLGCHDGTVALDSFGGAAGGTFMGTFAPDANFDTTLADDHPVSFTYNAALAIADIELEDPDVKVTALGGTVSQDLLFGGQLECASCHDVHNTKGNAGLLQIDNANSALCLTCHKK